jgi:hypothetical protein
MPSSRSEEMITYMKMKWPHMTTEMKSLSSALQTHVWSFLKDRSSQFLYFWKNECYGRNSSNSIKFFLSPSWMSLSAFHGKWFVLSFHSFSTFIFCILEFAVVLISIGNTVWRKFRYSSILISGDQESFHLSFSKRRAGRELLNSPSKFFQVPLSSREPSFPMMILSVVS